MVGASGRATAMVRCMGGACTASPASAWRMEGPEGEAAREDMESLACRGGTASLLPPKRDGRTIGISASAFSAGQYGQRSHDSSMKCPFSHRLSATRLPSSTSRGRSEEHTSELQSHSDLVCRLLLVKKTAL